MPRTDEDITKTCFDAIGPLTDRIYGIFFKINPLTLDLGYYLKSPGFWFVDIQDPENKQQNQNKKTTISKANHLIRLKELFVRHFALALLIHETIPSGFEKYFKYFD